MALRSRTARRLSEGRIEPECTSFVGAVFVDAYSWPEAEAAAFRAYEPNSVWKPQLDGVEQIQPFYTIPGRVLCGS